MFKNSVVTMLFLISGLLAQAEDSGNKTSRYPLYILGGTTVKVPGNQDTLWVLKNSQFKRAIEIAGLQKIDAEKVVLLERKIALFQEIAENKDEIIAAYKEGYDHYRIKWEETDKKLEEAEIKAAQRWRFFQVGLLVGVGVTIALSAYFRGL